MDEPNINKPKETLPPELKPVFQETASFYRKWFPVLGLLLVGAIVAVAMGQMVVFGIILVLIFAGLWYGRWLSLKRTVAAVEYLQSDKLSRTTKIKNAIGFIVCVILGLTFWYFFGRTDQNTAQCSKTAQIYFNATVAAARPGVQTYFGADSTDTYDYSYHYNNSSSECVVSIHQSVLSAKDTLPYTNYELVNLTASPSGQVIGALGYVTNATSAGIISCTFNGAACNSIDEYTNLAKPYLNN